MSLTADIAARAGAICWDDLPAKVKDATRLCLADGLAVMLGALRLEPAVQPFQSQAETYGPGPAHMLGGRKVPAVAAALANGALSHALDFEDTFDAAGLHVNASVVPTVLALAEHDDILLGDALAAMALGGDLACRIGLALASDPATRGWYHPPMIGAAGATLAGAQLLRLTPDQTAAALSLAQVQFALTDALKRSPLSDLRAIRDAFAARAATEAVLLARTGVTGTADPLGEIGGLGDLLSGQPLSPDAFAEFGQTFMTPDLSLKLWPACRGTHPAIALALDLRAEGVGPHDIVQADFTLQPPDDMLFLPRADRIRPESAIAAKFSIPFTFAQALIHGAPGLDTFSDAAFRDETALALAARVTMDRCDATVPRSARLTLADGRQFDRPLPQPPALRAGETTFVDLTPKLRDCLGPNTRALDTLITLETAAPTLPVRRLMADLVGDGAL